MVMASFSLVVVLGYPMMCVIISQRAVATTKDAASLQDGLA
jgi:hypothetical protein